MRRFVRHTFLAAALAGCWATLGGAQTILFSDSFERTTGSFGDPGEIPPDPGFSDWGSFDNALGGTVTPRPYLTTNANNSNQQTVGLPEDSAAGYGAIRFGRTILNYNLATDPFVQAGGGFVVQYKINPTDVGGRDWAGVALIDTNSLLRVGGQGAVAAAGNDNMRLALMPRNSGSLLIRRNNSTDVDVPSTAAGNAPNDDDASEYRRLVGNPLGAFNEPVFDPVALAEYTALMAGDPASTVAYPSDVFYSVRLEITSPDFTVRNGPAFARIFINDQEVD
ncbi:MAG TPA: hypothetical protein PJ982_05900, partial [Lacipirellulaceae bacterium]|nr:hypothetical protein [Lacipirellulaceae bacterium]